MDEADRIAQIEEARLRRRPKQRLDDDGVIISHDVPDAERK